MDDMTAASKRLSLMTGAAILTDVRKKILLCSCEKTMTVDAGLVRTLFPNAEVETAHHLCRGDIGQFQAALASDTFLIIGCTQEAPLFSELAGDHDIHFVNLRETAGWSAEAGQAAPKQAALIAAAAEAAPEIAYVTLSSQGVLLIYGRDEAAIEAATLLKDAVDITVLIQPPADIVPQRVTSFPIVSGRVRKAKGHIGAFELSIADYARPLPSSRDTLIFEPVKEIATSHCDIILDLSGGPSLFPGADLRDGYLRADPGDPAAIARAALKARDLIGTFDKPRYITFNETLCAHSRSKIVGCKRCLDLCPAGAITPAGNHVAIDAAICAGCGQCAAACPTGAAAYALPPADTLIRRLRALLLTYSEAGGEHAIVLLHDEDHGTPLIEALARFGNGLPANVLPLAVNEVTQIGLETVASAFAYGASALRFLTRAKPRHDILGLKDTLALAMPLLNGLGLEGRRADTIETDDPDALATALTEIGKPEPVSRPATFLPIGNKREILRLALQELHRLAPVAAERIILPEGAPFGAIAVKAEGCTLCLSCVSACPTGALGDNAEKPMLRFTEDLCVQCGLCKATCPEKVITLTPRLDFSTAASRPRVLKEEEPFHCTCCGTPFGTKSTIERIATMLAGQHWMYREGDPRLKALTMCADCRMKTAAEAQLTKASANAAHPVVRTTDDYLREREDQKRK